jgi:hypothetical protein
VGEAAREEDVDDALGDAFAGFVEFLGTHRLLAEELREGQAEPAEEADMEELAAGRITVERIAWAGGFHGWKRVSEAAIRAERRELFHTDEVKSAGN